MYNTEYIVYMNTQIKKAKQELIEEIVNDLKEILHMSHPLTTEKYLKKWEERSK